MFENLFGSDELQIQPLQCYHRPLSNPPDNTRLQTPNETSWMRASRGMPHRFADTAALRQGRHVANWAFDHFLRPEPSCRPK